MLREPCEPGKALTVAGTHGPAFDARVDGERIARQHERIRDYMLPRGGPWRTLAEIAGALEYPEASVSAQLRHLRKPAFGAFVVEKRRRDGAGLWEYRVSRPATPAGREPVQERLL